MLAAAAGRGLERELGLVLARELERGLELALERVLPVQAATGRGSQRALAPPVQADSAPWPHRWRAKPPL
jgi:hypothetical protein